MFAEHSPLPIIYQRREISFVRFFIEKKFNGKKYHQTKKKNYHPEEDYHDKNCKERSRKQQLVYGRFRMYYHTMFYGPV
jgi:hypothetical protein